MGRQLLLNTSLQHLNLPYQEINSPPINPYLLPPSLPSTPLPYLFRSFLSSSSSSTSSSKPSHTPSISPLWELPTIPLLLLPPPQTQLTSSAILRFNCNGILHYIQELSSLPHSKTSSYHVYRNLTNNSNNKQTPSRTTPRRCP